GGPFARALTEDLARLVAERRLDRGEHRGTGWLPYVTTAAGETEAEAVLAVMSPTEIDFLRKVRHFVTTRSFNRLLTDVYRAFPDFAVNSRFTGCPSNHDRSHRTG